MKAILIARVSTEEQREAGNSLPAQVARLEKYCQNKKFTIIKTCSFDESAYTNNREEFDKIIDFILNQDEKIAVCCDKVDRLSRNMFDKRVSQLYNNALDDKIELHFVSDGQIITSKISATEKFQFSISLGLARYYSDAISDNVKRAQEQMLRNGTWLAKAPFGYKNIKHADGTTDIIVEEEKAQLLKKIFELYATGAYSMDLVRAKIQQDYNVKWAKGYLSKTLANPFFYGVMLAKGQEYPHRYPAIISKELFDKVQTVRQTFHKQPIKYAGKPSIYRGLIRCGDCGLTITPEKHKGIIYYHCTQYKGKHNAAWFREDTITKFLQDFFKKFQMPEDIAAQTVDTLEKLDQDKVKFHEAQLTKLTTEHKTVTKMLDNLYLDKLKGRITDSDHDRFYTNLKEELDNINGSMQRLQEAENNYYVTTKYLIDFAFRAHDFFTSSEVEEKRLVIKLALSNFYISGENIFAEAKKPFNLIIKCSEGFLWRG